MARAPESTLEGLLAVGGGARRIDRRRDPPRPILCPPSPLRRLGEAGGAPRAGGLVPQKPPSQPARPILMKILGISAHYHDSAAALVVDGIPVCSVQEERLSRRKGDSDFPMAAI